MAKKTTKSNQCSCISQVNQLLEEYNTQLDLSFNLDGKTYIKLATLKLDTSVRGKIKTVVCTYCPFCGKKLQ